MTGNEHTGVAHMSIVTTGPILSAFKSVLTLSGKPLQPETEECSASVVRLLSTSTADRPGMLLGKVQSGKTRAFVGAIAIAFDNGYDIAIVLTKTSTPLAEQTLRRLRSDLGPAVTKRLVIIEDAARKIGPLNHWQRERKLIVVAKKHPKNLENVRGLFADHPDLKKKRVLVVDDEADFASVGYQGRAEVARVRPVQTLIHNLRSEVPNAVYLEVTATPYSLYLQPADIEEPATGVVFKPVRPAFTKRVHPHASYIGGEYYFDAARTAGTVASHMFVPVPETELAWMRRPTRIPAAELLTTPSLESLRRAVITFVVGGVLRQHDEAGSDEQRLFSFIIHVDRLRGSHADHQTLARDLIEQLRTAALTTPPVNAQLKAAYDDLKTSRSIASLTTPPLRSLLSAITEAFASISTKVVNIDSDLKSLLDDSGQLKQDSPFNIYIGGQSLDRGVTIADVIGFYYGRLPKVSQQDTTVQHCRMYGPRPEGDLAVTRFYTSQPIYDRMRRMHEFDQMLWTQLHEKEKHGETVEDAGDVVFVQSDIAGGIRPCLPNKVVLTRAQFVRPGGELVPRPLTTVSDKPSPATVGAVLDDLRVLSKPSKPFEMTVESACGFLDKVCDLVRIDDGWQWDLDALKDAVRHLAGAHPNPAQKDRVAALYTLDNTIRKWKDAAKREPQNAPYGSATENTLRTFAGESPAIAFFHNVGNADADWRGSPFVWPVLFVPPGAMPAIFANNRRKGGRKPRKR